LETTCIPLVDENGLDGSVRVYEQCYEYTPVTPYVPVSEPYLGLLLASGAIFLLIYKKFRIFSLNNCKK